MYKFRVDRRKGASEEEYSRVFTLPKTSIYKDNEGKVIIDLLYGYHHVIKDYVEKSDSVCVGTTLKYHDITTPQENDYITDIKSGRTFRVGKIEGFVVYQAPLYEGWSDIEPVAYLKFEDYHKD